MDISVFNTLLVNYDTRVTTWQGRSYIVAPVVLLAEGVHIGVDGLATYYPAEELAKFPYSWNGVPLPIEHPRDGENLISAQDPTVIERQVVGNLWNVEFIDNKLKGEIWVDVEKAKMICPAILSRLNNRGELEVSTGLGVEEEIIRGEWNEETYERIVRNYRPDHLALLPDGQGACSYTDGCGVRANEDKEGGDKVKLWIDAKKVLAENAELASLMIVLEASYEQIRGELQKAVDAMDNSAYVHFVKAVYNDYFVYKAQANSEAPGPYRDSKMFKQKYSVAENGSIELKDDPVEVREEINYITLEEGGKDMGDQVEKCCPEKVAALIANEGNSYTEDDKGWLEALTEEQLAKIEGEDKAKTDVQLAAEEGAKELEALKTNADAGNTDDDTDDTEETPATAEEYIAAAPAEIREVLESGARCIRPKRTSWLKPLWAMSATSLPKNSLRRRMSKSWRTLRTWLMLQSTLRLTLAVQRMLARKLW